MTGGCFKLGGVKAGWCKVGVRGRQKHKKAVCDENSKKGLQGSERHHRRSEKHMEKCIAALKIFADGK